MGILKRIWNWLCSLFGGRRKEKDTAADYERCVSRMQEALRNMKAQTEAVIAAQEKRKREIAQCRDQIARMERYAQKAAAEGNDRDAGFFLEKKDALNKQLDELSRQSEAAASYTSQAEALYRRAESQLNDITARKDAVKAKLAAAELLESMNSLENGGLDDSLKQQAAKAQAAIDKAEALAELESRSAGSDLDALMSKYDQAEDDRARTQDGSGQEACSPQ